MLGLVLNIAIFLAFKNAEEAVGHSAYFQRKMTTIGAACVAMILVIGEIFMAKALGRQGSLLISGLCGITSLAALVLPSRVGVLVYLCTNSYNSY